MFKLCCLFSNSLGQQKVFLLYQRRLIVQMRFCPLQCDCCHKMMACVLPLLEFLMSGNKVIEQDMMCSTADIWFRSTDTTPDCGNIWTDSCVCSRLRCRLPWHVLMHPCLFFRYCACLNMIWVLLHTAHPFYRAAPWWRVSYHLSSHTRRQSCQSCHLHCSVLSVRYLYIIICIFTKY